MTDADRISFLVVGVQKAGTTALFDYLADDPSLCLPDNKEIHFFDNDGLDWSLPDYSAYHAHFPANDPRPKGEATPIYLYWPGALDRIAKYNPRVRLVVMLRDPVERAWSHWRMETSRGVEQNAFSWCIRQGRQRLFDCEPWGHHREFSYVERGFYGEQMAKLLDIFPNDQVLVLRAEDLKSDPEGNLGRVNQLIGARGRPIATSRQSHVGPIVEGLSAADIDHLRSLYQADQRRLKALTGIHYA